MEYLVEVNNLLREQLFKSWMNEEDFNRAKEEALAKAGTSLEDLAIGFESALNNGHSLEDQRQIFKAMFKRKGV